MRYRVTARLPEGSRPGDLPGLLDMLRYDRAVVEDWDLARSGEQQEVTGATSGASSVTLTLSGDRCTTDRWRSFGLVPVSATPPHDPLA